MSDPMPGQPAFVLVRPQMGENIGAAARAMWNFGLDRMRLVAPRDGWPNPAADAMASGAGRLLDEAGLFADLGGAVADCTYVMATTAEFPSLNLAQCVLLCAYDWRRATAEVVAARVDMAGADWAEMAEIERLADHYEERLDAAGFFFPEDKAARMKTNLRNLWSRLPLTRADVRMLHGVMRQMVRRSGRG